MHLLISAIVILKLIIVVGTNRCSLSFENVDLQHGRRWWKRWAKRILPLYRGVNSVWDGVRFGSMLCKLLL